MLITLDKPFNLVSSPSTSSLALGSSKTCFASGSVSVVVPSVRNGLFLSRACPLRGSCFPEFAIELLSVAFSVLLAFLPTVAFPSTSSVAEVVDDTTGAGVASAGFEVVVSA